MDNYAVTLEDLVKRVASGGAVLFLGSGFSADATGLDDDDLPTAPGLAKAIGALGGFDAEGDLRYAADRYLQDGDPQKLITLLRNTFTVKDVEDHHRIIAAAPWRRVYTTNYDTCLEQAALSSSKRIETLDLSDSPADYAAKNNVCVHLNGSMKNLTAATLNGAFKLSESSYLDPESFVTSSWNLPFQRDLSYASAIVFVGYSLYDIEVKKILYANNGFKGKTFFFTRDRLSDKTQFTFSEFGTVLPLKAVGLSDALRSSFKV